MKNTDYYLLFSFSPLKAYTSIDTYERHASFLSIRAKNKRNAILFTPLQ